MNILMIGTPICPKCKALAPQVEEYCKEHNIEYEYTYINNAPKYILDILREYKVSTAPVLIINNGEKLEVLLSDDIKERFCK